MKFLKYTYIAILFICMVTLTGFVQSGDPFLQKLAEQLGLYSKMYPEEKIYLQIDKPFYKPGEDIWFNAFVLNSNTHNPTSLSDVVYVVLKDPKGNEVKMLDLFVQQGTAKGDFKLDDFATGGIYTLEAYTRWMRNFGEESYFRKEIQVQKIITPRMLLKLDFEKEAYGPGDEVIATFSVKNLKNEAVAGATVSLSVKVQGESVHTHEAVTTTDGNVSLKYILPDKLNTADGLFQVIVADHGMQESITRSIPIVLNKIDVQFYPEGGDLVAGAASVVAFKATNEFGKAADIAGVIVDEANAEVATFESYHMGMGAFRFTPLAGKKYYAQISKPVGTNTRMLLPAAVSSGYTLAFENVPGKSLGCTVYASDNGEAFLVGQTHGEIYYAKKISVAKGATQVSIPVTDFPSGIAVFTLFNGEGLEECERLVYLNKEKTLQIEIIPDKKHYQPREKVTVSVRTTDATGKAVPAKLSLSVVDDQLISFADDKQDNILSWMMLSSELKGKIQEPSFYFDASEPKADKALDYLLMTHGWRRYTWKDVVKNDKAIIFLPESLSVLSGIAHDKQNAGVENKEVILLELGNRRRIAKVKTIRGGHFAFRNIDASVPLLLLTQQPDQIEVNPKKVQLSYSNQTISSSPFTRETIETVISAVPEMESDQVENIEETKADDMDFNMKEDVSALSEVIVVGYGTEESRKLVGYTTIIRDTPLENASGYFGVENILQGRVAGLQVQQPAVSSEASASLRIRGNSSLAIARGEPLYVIDGQLIGTSLNQNFANGSIVGPENIARIEVMQGPDASALYGSAAANGAIVITTKSNTGASVFHSRKRKVKYTSKLVPSRNFSSTREFFVEVPEQRSDEVRKDFRTTIYWNHTVVTDEDGKAKVTFYNNDAASAFRITAEGITGNGLLGRREEVYFTQLPFSLDVKIPDFIGYEDTLHLPVMLKNTTAKTLKGKLSVAMPEQLRALSETELAVDVDPMQTKTYWVKIIPRGIEGKFSIAMRLTGNTFSDEVKHDIEVHPVGFPVKLSFSAKDVEKNINVTIQDMEAGSLKGEAVAFTDVLADLFTGAESILQAPHGCFEQVSSSTFPNILALQFLKQSGDVRPDVEKMASTYISNGYKQLMAYEIDGGGFEWFGSPPAHEGLTAYGLLEFFEMKKIYAGVNEAMMKRTQEWLLSRRRGDGTFKQNKGKYGFAAASAEVTNAYVVYALTETGTTAVEVEYNYSLEEAWKSKDMYRMALMANASFSMGKMKEYERLTRYFREQCRAVSFEELKVDHSIVRSYGNSLTNETVSLWTLALLKAQEQDIDLIRACVQFIASKRSYGMFGSTQATALALKVLTEYARYMRTERDSGTMSVSVNKVLAGTQPYTKDTRDKIVIGDLSQHLKTGNNIVQVKFEDTDSALPYSVNIQWNTKTPVSNKQCKVTLKTSLAQQRLQVNNTVRMTATLQNTTNEGIPMTVALVGIPAGLSLQPWQLKELQEKSVFDFYEIIGDKLAIYYRELEPAATRTIRLDLKAEVPGRYTSVASTAYLYYTDEIKYWTKGNTVTINP